MEDAAQLEHPDFLRSRQDFLNGSMQNLPEPRRPHEASGLNNGHGSGLKQPHG
jgi:hypothetical protein